ncbi:MAG: YidC/Oxa1 family membrane protein insertase [bacterium]|nr:YidC/Oxa1 family membrane protein insertase [bacterium]
MFDTFIVQPVMNLLILIYAIIPGHNFGLAIIIFTIVVRFLMWPLVRKQLHHSKAMRKLQPEIKRIKKEAKGNRQEESRLVMELYKEKEINPLAPIGLLIVQLPIFIGLYQGIQKIVKDPEAIHNLAYSFIKPLVENIEHFDETLFGFVDLSRAAGGEMGFYLPAFIIVFASAIVQFYQAKQIQPNEKDQKSLKDIFKGAQNGEKSDSSDVNAAIARSTKFLIPAMVFVFTYGLASALPLYWLTSGVIALIQQKRVLQDDTEELEATATDKKSNKAIKAEVIPAKKKKQTKKGKKTSGNKSKRRK